MVPQVRVPPCMRLHHTNARCLLSWNTIIHGPGLLSTLGSSYMQLLRRHSQIQDCRRTAQAAAPSTEPRVLYQSYAVYDAYLLLNCPSRM